MSATGGPTTYRLDPAVVLRAAGPVFVVVGVCWVLLALAGGGTALRALVALLTLALLVAAVVALIRPPRVLTLSADGFRVSMVRGVGAASADWSEVDSVDIRVARGSPSIVVALTGGRSSVVPLSLLGRRGLEALREIHDRLNQAHGYRHLDAP